MITQREWDIMQIEAELKIKAITDKWVREFLGVRISAPQQMNSSVRSSEAPLPEEIEGVNY